MQFTALSNQLFSSTTYRENRVISRIPRAIYERIIYKVDMNIKIKTYRAAIKLAKGFSLIDLMVAMVVIGIGLAITVPAMQGFMNDNRQAEMINRLRNDITFAKNAALKGGNVTIATVGGPVWDVGWAVTDAAAIVLRTAPPLTVPGQTLVSTAGLTTVTFRPGGSITAGGPFTVELCKACIDPLYPNRDKQLTVSVTGRITLNSQFACVPAPAACP